MVLFGTILQDTRAIPRRTDCYAKQTLIGIVEMANLFKFTTIHAQFFANVGFWFMFTIITTFALLANEGASFIQPLTPEVASKLQEIISVNQIITVLTSLLILFILVFLIQHKFSTDEGKKRLDKIRRALYLEVESVFLTFGSLSLSAAWFLHDVIYALGVCFWVIWLFLKLKENTADQ